MSAQTTTFTHSQPSLRPPTTTEVISLAAEKHPGCLSLLMSTVPAEEMVPRDRSTLHLLSLEAHRRLTDYPDPESRMTMRIGLEDAIEQALSTPTDRGLAILVSPDQSRVFHLRVSPHNRVVLDPTFATRDLLRSATEDPAFLMLVIDGKSARLLHYDQQSLKPLRDSGFPLANPTGERRTSPSGRRELRFGRDRARAEETRAFLREVDARLATSAAHVKVPVVLLGSDRTLAEFLDIAPARRIAAVVRTGHGNSSVLDLEHAGRTALAAHVNDRTAAALETATVRLNHGRAVTGLIDAWAAMEVGEPELLVVEHSHQAPARVTDWGLSLVDDPAEYGVLDDAVDELIEVALSRGTEVVMVPPGSLAKHGHLILTLRGSARRTLRTAVSN